MHDSNTANNAIIALACIVSNGGLSLESNTPPQGINPEFLHASTIQVLWNEWHRRQLALDIQPIQLNLASFTGSQKLSSSVLTTGSGGGPLVHSSFRRRSPFPFPVVSWIRWVCMAVAEFHHSFIFFLHPFHSIPRRETTADAEDFNDQRSNTRSGETKAAKADRVQGVEETERRVGRRGGICANAL